jgi:predicted RNA polymerase sigma factor
VVERVFREHRAKMLAALVRALGDIELAEDALQEACALALRRWPQTQVPEDPVAWLLLAARNRAIDRLRRARMAQVKQAEAAAQTDWAQIAALYDDLARQIGQAAYKVTDEQVASVVEEAGSQRAAFELIVASTLGAGLHRWRRGRKVLEEALGTTQSHVPPANTG